jgi:hypothetical protein
VVTIIVVSIDDRVYSKVPKLGHLIGLEAGKEKQNLRLKVVLQKECVDGKIEENSGLVDNIAKAERIERLHSVAGFLIDPESYRAHNFSEEASIGAEIELDITGLKD